MRADAAFTWPVPQGRRWRLVRRALLGVVLLVQGAWAVELWSAHAVPSWAVLGPLAVAVAAAAVALAPWSSSSAREAGWLRWDGQCWSLCPEGPPSQAGVPGQMRLLLDAGDLLLLQFTPWVTGTPPRSRGRRQWLWLERGEHAASWHPLRAAVYCCRSVAPQQTLDS